MILLEQLYRLLAADEQTRLLDPFIRRNIDSLNDITINRQFDVPERHALLLTHALLIARPGAGQIVNNAHIFAQPPNAPVAELAAQVNALAANAVGLISWQGELILPAGCNVLGRSAYNAGANVNQQEFQIAGMLIPLGNIERL